MAFCSICLDEFDFRVADEEKRIVALLCSHVFHDACLEPCERCPKCRTRIRYGEKIRLRFDVEEDIAQEVAARAKKALRQQRSEELDYNVILEALDEANAKIDSLEKENGATGCKKKPVEADKDLDFDEVLKALDAAYARIDLLEKT